MAKKTIPYRTRLLESLTDPEEAAQYLRAAKEESTQMFRKALLDVVQAQKVAKVAKKAGVQRESLYKAFSFEGNPTLDTLEAVFGVLDLDYDIVARRSATPAQASNPPIAHYGRRHIRQKRSGSRRRTIAEAAGQLVLPFDRVVNVQSVQSPQTSYILRAAPSPLYMGTAPDLQPTFGGLHPHLRFVNQGTGESVEAVPEDLLILTSTVAAGTTYTHAFERD